MGGKRKKRATEDRTKDDQDRIDKITDFIQSREEFTMQELCNYFQIPEEERKICVVVRLGYYIKQCPKRGINWRRAQRTDGERYYTLKEKCGCAKIPGSMY